MKRLFLAIAVLLAWNCVAWTAVNEVDPAKEPKGFRGILWGQDIGTLADLRFQGEDKDGRKLYTIKGDKMLIGEAKLTAVAYGFLDDKFNYVLIKTEGEENVGNLFDALSNALGEPSLVAGDYHFWQFPNVHILFSYKLAGRKAEIFYSYQSLAEQALDIWGQNESSSQREKRRTGHPLEPKGFRDVVWGDDINKFPDMIQDKHKGLGLLKTYERRHDPKSIGGARLAGIFYGFYNNKFTSFGLLSRGAENSRLLLEALIQEYGQPQNKHYDKELLAEEHEWTFPKISLSYKYYEQRKEAQVICFSYFHFKDAEVDIMEERKKEISDF